MVRVAGKILQVPGHKKRGCELGGNMRDMSQYGVTVVSSL